VIWSSRNLGLSADNHYSLVPLIYQIWFPWMLPSCLVLPLSAGQSPANACNCNPFTTFSHDHIIALCISTVKFLWP